MYLCRVGRCLESGGVSDLSGLGQVWDLLTLELARKEWILTVVPV